MQFRIVLEQDGARSAVEHMVASVFYAEHGAIISRFPDTMIAVFDTHGLPVCAAGLRDHSTGFFSEYYLNHPVEQMISTKAELPVRREEILELGSLAAQRPGALLLLLQGFASLGIGRGYRWGIFTATRRLRRLATRLAIRHTDLGAAQPHCVPEPASWGRYYDCDPRVCAVDGTAARLRDTGTAMTHLAATTLPSSAIVTSGWPENAKAAM